MKYLYGATIDGIQQYIFQTGKLKEIVGGSELIERICNQYFKEALGESYNPKHSIVEAAGKIIYLFKDKIVLEKFVGNYFKTIKSNAPNIQLSQAIVELSDAKSFKDSLDELERELEIKKNKKPKVHGLSLMISERSRRTGGAGVKRNENKQGKKEVVIDRDQEYKLEIVKEETSNPNKNSLFKKLLSHKDYNLPLDINHIAPPEEKSGLAIIHADGNSLGRIIESIYEKMPADRADEMGLVLSEFSRQINESTIAAARSALAYVLEKHPKLKDNKTLPLRPIILGGDDLTLIIRGDLAIDYTQAFLQDFQDNTKNNFQYLVDSYGLDFLKEGLTACAGISFIKSNYPFHYGVNLSEELCKHSKKIAKNKNANLVPSCLTFHKVQSSFVEDFDTITNRELTAGDVVFKNGPYFLEKQKGYSTLSELKKWVREINSIDAPKSGLRKWLTELHSNSGSPEQLMNRIKNLNGNYLDRLDINKGNHIRTRKVGEDEVKVTHVFDMLTLASIEGI